MSGFGLAISYSPAAVGLARRSDVASSPRREQSSGRGPLIANLLCPARRAKSGLANPSAMIVIDLAGTVVG